MINRFLDKLDGIVVSEKTDQEFNDAASALALEFETVMANRFNQFFTDATKYKDTLLSGMSSSDRRKLAMLAISRVRLKMVWNN